MDSVLFSIIFSPFVFYSAEPVQNNNRIQKSRNIVKKHLIHWTDIDYEMNYKHLLVFVAEKERKRKKERKKRKKENDISL